jgi:hypothetical protein
MKSPRENIHPPIDMKDGYRQNVPYGKWTACGVYEKPIVFIAVL